MTHESKQQAEALTTGKSNDRISLPICRRPQSQLRASCLSEASSAAHSTAPMGTARTLTAAHVASELANFRSTTPSALEGAWQHLPETSQPVWEGKTDASRELSPQRAGNSYRDILTAADARGEQNSPASNAVAKAAPSRVAHSLDDALDMSAGRQQWVFEAAPARYTSPAVESQQRGSACGADQPASPEPKPPAFSHESTICREPPLPESDAPLLYSQVHVLSRWAIGLRSVLHAVLQHILMLGT